MRACFVTRSAAESAARQFHVPHGATRAVVAQAYAQSVKIPQRHSARLLRRAFVGKTAPAVRVSGSMLLVCRDTRVVSVRRLQDADIATLLTWALTGAWITGEV